MRALVALSLLFVCFDMKRNAGFLTLRENFRMRDQGRFQADDFVEKRQ